ncbi:unnamed protein product [Closterium sp. Naga37s-1]|nr:unnamed protein product [Closterium sp. Naga37s-1]
MARSIILAVTLVLAAVVCLSAVSVDGAAPPTKTQLRAELKKLSATITKKYPKYAKYSAQVNKVINVALNSKYDFSALKNSTLLLMNDAVADALAKRFKGKKISTDTAYNLTAVQIIATPRHSLSAPLSPPFRPCIPSFPPLASPPFPPYFPSFPPPPIPLLSAPASPPFPPLLPLLSPPAFPPFPPLLPLLSAPAFPPFPPLASPPFPPLASPPPPPPLIPLLSAPAFPPFPPLLPLLSPPCFSSFPPLLPLRSPPAFPPFPPLASPPFPPLLLLLSPTASLLSPLLAHRSRLT